jgi:hypothetical protein
MSDEKRVMRKEKSGKGARGDGLGGIGYDIKKLAAIVPPTFFVSTLWGGLQVLSVISFTLH